MKDYLSIPMYAWHYVIGVALYYGYDYESDVENFLPEDALEQVEHRLSSGEAITLNDWFKASKEIYTDAFIGFVIGMNKLIEDGKVSDNPTAPLIVSMHSGSSDYFTVSMVTSFTEVFSEYKK